MNIEEFIYFTNVIGVVAFAVSGVLKGFKHQLDLLGMVVLSVVTAVGGGVIRDMTVNRIPVVIKKPQDIYVAACTAVLVFVVLKRKLELEKKFIKYVLLMDAIGLAVFTIIGADVGVDYGLLPVPTAILATITGVGGGIIRDMLVGEIPIVLKEDVYAVLCFIGGILYYYLIKEGINQALVYLIVFILVLTCRIIAMRYKLNLPR